MSYGDFSLAVSQSLIQRFYEDICEGFDPQKNAETISEGELEGMHKETFWDSLEAQGTEKLVIVCKDGKSVTYENGFFKRLLENKPELADLTQFIKVEFSDGGEREEPKAKLCMCGKTIENLFERSIGERVNLPCLTLESFQWVLHAIENEVKDISSYSEVVQKAMDDLDFNPARVPAGVHGKNDWNARGVDVGEVPPLPKELLEALNQPCPIANDGSKMIDTHVILWLPPKLNGEPMTVNSLEEMAKADAFGHNKIGYEDCSDTIRGNNNVNQPLDRSYWMAQYKKPVACGLSFGRKRKYIKDNCPGYEMAKVRETIASSLMQYGCSGDKKERILAKENAQCYSTNEEKIGHRIAVGKFSFSGLSIVKSNYFDPASVGVCPVRRFF